MVRNEMRVESFDVVVLGARDSVFAFINLFGQSLRAAEEQVDSDYVLSFEYRVDGGSSRVRLNTEVFVIEAEDRIAELQPSLSHPRIDAVIIVYDPHSETLESDFDMLGDACNQLNLSEILSVQMQVDAQDNVKQALIEKNIAALNELMEKFPAENQFDVHYKEPDEIFSVDSVASKLNDRLEQMKIDRVYRENARRILRANSLFRAVVSDSDTDDDSDNSSIFSASY